MKKWEYKVLSHIESPETDEIEDFLNELGEDGWELVSVSTSLRTYFLKRVKHENQTD